MESGERSTLLFDLDGVLCQYDLSVRLDVLSALTGRAPEDIRTAIWSSGFEDDADAGVFATGSAYLDAFAERLGYPITRDEWADARRRSMTPYPEMLDLVARLRCQYTVAVLTNNVPLLREMMPEIFPEISDLFGDRVFFSCDMRLAKPDPEIYRQVAQKLRVACESCVFVDDKTENAKGASAAGMLGIHFTGYDVLVNELRAASVDI